MESKIIAEDEGVSKTPISIKEEEREEEEEETWPVRMSPCPVHIDSNTYTVYSQNYRFPSYSAYSMPSYYPYYGRRYTTFEQYQRPLPVYSQRFPPPLLMRPRERTKPSCDICMKTFTRVSSLKVHMRIHRGERPYVCTECGRAFSQSGNLKVHMRIHNGIRPYECHLCGRSFIQSSSFKSHTKSHMRNQKSEGEMSPSSQNNSAVLEPSNSNHI